MFELKHCKVTDGWSWEEKKLAGDGSGLMGRWRHSATPIEDRYIMIVGGLVSGGRVLDDILMIDTVTSIVTQLPGRLPGGRHSHTALRYNENVLIIGGLDDALSPINDIIQISINNGNICHFPLSIPARYGMSSHMMSHDLAILVGGVSLEPLSPEIIYIDLKEKKLINKRVKMIGNEGSIETVPLLFGHTSQVMQDDVIVFGGGGNCFSFGTHFTKNLIEINND
jgi:tRNA wybutosine-synthesizing protein 4